MHDIYNLTTYTINNDKHNCPEIFFAIKFFQSKEFLQPIYMFIFMAEKISIKKRFLKIKTRLGSEYMETGMKMCDFEEKKKTTQLFFNIQFIHLFLMDDSEYQITMLFRFPWTY